MKLTSSLGLESDRRNRTSSYQAHEQPRVLPGMAPGRPSFQGGRNSVATSMYLGNGGAHSSDDVMMQRRAHSTSASRLTQVSMYGDDFDRSSGTTEKKKGFKGLIQKMKKGKRDPSRRGTEELAPPPPMGFLVNRQDGKHNRNRSGSSSSFVEAPSPVPQQQIARSVPSGSINGPMTAASSGSDVSPTSSRFGPDGRQRTNPVPELPPGAESAGYPGATMEMLAHLPGNSPVQATHPQQQLEAPTFTDEPQAMNRDPFARSGETTSDGNRSPSLYTVQGGSRKSMQPSVSSRLSTSTTMQGLETPDGQAPNSYLNGSYAQQPPSQQSLSPNRHKNLPPLPPGMATPDMYSSHQDDNASISIRTSLFDPKRMSSMDQGRALCPPSSDYFPTASPRYHQAPMPNGAVQSSPSSTGSSVMQPQANLPLPRRPIQPRASFDVLSDARARIRRSTAESGRLPMEDMGGRNAQSMYIQQPAAASTGSFGRFISRDASKGLVVPTLREPYGEERKERRRGIKSIFSSKAR